jgi:hypothetical protein
VTKAPAMSGPTTCPTLLVVKLRVLAAGTSSAGTSRGTMAPRAELATAKKPAWTATSSRISGTLFNPSRVCASRPRVTSQVPMELTRYSSRRSTVSATAPPHSPNATSGRNPTSPTRPTSSDEPDSAYTCTGTATWVSMAPMNEVPWPST